MQIECLVIDYRTQGNEILVPSWQKELWQTSEETSGYVGPEQVNKWHIYDDDDCDSDVCNSYIAAVTRMKLEGRGVERTKSGGYCEGAIHLLLIITDGEANFTALQVPPRQCPLVLLVKVGWKQGKELVSGIA
jgi:hypothetical protein